MKHSTLQAMSLDDLWAFHEIVNSILAQKIEVHKRELEDRLERLGRRFDETANVVPQRRPYPKAFPKYQNPTRPSEKWSGRGRRPIWVSELLEAGRTIDDLRI